MPDSAEHPSRLDDSDEQRQAWRKLPRRLFATLFTLDTLVMLLYFGAVAFHLSRSRYFVLVNLDAEGNPPSWYAGTQLFFIAIGYLTLGSKLVPDRRRVAVLRPLWFLMGAGFTFLSMDEVGAVHERIGSLLYRLKIFNHPGYPDQWMSLYIVIAACLVLLFAKQLIIVWREWRTEALLFVLGVVILAGGAFVLEQIEIMRRWEGARHILEIGLEEWFEMVGATILVLPAYRILAYTMTSDPDPQEADTPSN